MKQLAADSKEVALRACKDNASMKMMTLIILCTLPGTFTAVSLLRCSFCLPKLTREQTFFSTSFFDFKPRDGSTTVSKWVWLYCAVTIGLTAILISVWYLADRAMARHFDKRGLGLPNTGDAESESAASTERIEEHQDDASPAATFRQGRSNGDYDNFPIHQPMSEYDASCLDSVTPLGPRHN